MKIAFLTELNFEGSVHALNEHMRTEYAWIHALGAENKFILNYPHVKGYDHVFIIFPKGTFNLNIVGAKIANNENPCSSLLTHPIVQTLKTNNKYVHYIQEGPTWLFNDYEIRAARFRNNRQRNDCWPSTLCQNLINSARSAESLAYMDLRRPVTAQQYYWRSERHK